MLVIPVPCLSDNYAYLVVSPDSREAAVVDPSESAPVIHAIEDEHVQLRAIWNTHHHFDHVGGNEEVARQYGIEDVLGHVSDRGRIPGQTHFVGDGDRFALGRLQVRVLHVPGHTLGAVAYVVTDSGAPGEPAAVFTGDTFFLAGCGRLFEGTAGQMHASLSALAALPAGTRIYCGHEYTLSNLRFAAHVEPSNPEIERAQRDAEARQAARQPTVPGTVARELEVNPFLRVSSAEIRRTLGIAPEADGAAALGAIRAAKDDFR